MKKILSVLIMAMFLISLASVAFAVQGQAGNAGTTGETAKYQIGEDRDTFVSEAEQKRQDLIEKRDMAREGKTGDQIEIAAKKAGLQRKFTENKQELEKVMQKMRQRKTNLQQNYQEGKQKLADIKSELSQCKGKADTACAETRTRAKEHANNFLLNSADRVLALLEKTRERVEQSEKLSPQEKNDALEKLDTRLGDMAGVRETIEQMDETATKEQIQEASKLLGDSWKGANKEVKTQAGKVAADKIGGILVQIERLQAKLQNKIEQMKKAGKDTSAIDAMMNDFNAKINTAKEAQVSAKEQYTAGNANEGTIQVRNAHQNIKQARTMLKDVVRKMAKVQAGKKVQQGLEPETAQEQAAEEAAETEATE